MAMLLKGQEVSAALTEELILRTEKLKSAGIVPTLAILRVGENPGDLSYEKGVMKRAEKIGICVRNMILPADAGRDDILGAVRSINEEASIHGCIMFRPLKDKAIEAEACALLDPSKDLDCMTAASLSSVFAGHGPGFAPCTAAAVMEIFRHYGIGLKGKKAAVIGRSLVIGKPVAMMMLSADATITVCHTKTPDPAALCREADILVVAAGKAGVVDHSFVRPGQVVIDVGINMNAEGKPVAMMMLSADATITVCHTKTPDPAALCREADILVVAAGKAGVVDHSFVRPGQVVIDVGINMNAEGKLCGDVLFDDVEPVVEAITPVPGGVGAVTNAVLCKHLIEACEASAGL